MRSRWAAAGALAVLLAGCGSSPGGPGTSTGPTSTYGTTDAPFWALDGEAAWDFTYGIVTKPDGSPHFRVPGTPDHAEAARWLHAMMANVTGWTVEWQNFTGEEYQGLDKGEVKRYYEDPGYCKPADRERLRGLRFSNLVGHLDGMGDRTVVLGAHWDSKRFATQDPVAANRTQPVLGANDGAAGVGVLLQLMWTLAGHGLPFDVEVVFFDGEDGFEDCHPLAGSLWYVHRLEDADVDGMRMLLLDMVGDPDARFVREAHGVECDPALVDLLYSKADRHALRDNFRDVGTTVLDDHVPFTQAGIPAVDLIDLGRSPQGTGHSFPPYWHTTHDTMENIDAGMLGRVGGLVHDVLRDPEFTASWPGPC